MGMKISELIKILKKLKVKHGDISVRKERFGWSDITDISFYGKEECYYFPIENFIGLD